MKKAFNVLLFSSLFLMCGCSAPISLPYEDDAEILYNNNVETLKNWSFQFNEETNDYSLFFGLLNKNNEEISAEIDVDIRIVNDEGEEVYEETKNVFETDFDYYTSQAAEEQYLAELRIPASDIISGRSSNGTVFFNGI